MKSMTAYASVTHGELTVEITSVNRRFLDVKCSLPKQLSSLEMQLRKQVASRLARGYVTLSISWSPEHKAHIVPDLEVAQGYKSALEQIALELGLEPKVTLEMLAKERGIFGGDATLDLPVQEIVDEALDAHIAMRKQEGLALQEEIETRCDLLSKILEKIKRLSSQAVQKQKEKLEMRIKELCDEERLFKEIALLAEKVDITEELVRFASHLEQMKVLMQQENSGKTLDFLTQELYREINTIGSKVQDAQVAHLVVEAKGEVEKIKEQVQNVE